MANTNGQTAYLSVQIWPEIWPTSNLNTRWSVVWQDRVTDGTRLFQLLESLSYLGGFNTNKSKIKNEWCGTFSSFSSCLQLSIKGWSAKIMISQVLLVHSYKNPTFFLLRTVFPSTVDLCDCTQKDRQTFVMYTCGMFGMHCLHMALIHCLINLEIDCRIVWTDY